MFRNVEICSFVIKLPRFHCPGKLPTFACRYTYHSFRSLSSFPKREAPAQRVPESGFVTSLAQNFIVVGFCGILPFSLRKQKCCVSLPWPECSSFASAFFTFILLSLRAFCPSSRHTILQCDFIASEEDFLPNSCGQRWRVFSWEVTGTYFFLVSGFWPKIASL